MERNTLLILKPGSRPQERAGMPGVCLDEKTEFTDDLRQAALLSTLFRRSLTPENAVALLRGLAGEDLDEAGASLALAGFILKFGDYLKE